ncbi:MAG TPA: DUF1080 domain-containing protein [Fimbriimonas sp.]|nr:DUF1080 domain-containing protein [Fimbriimonas sp.]
MLVWLPALVLVPPMNMLTLSEQRAGWKLLFDGKTTQGWHNFRKEGVGSGWQVKDGTLTSVDPGAAGDIVTNDKYDWFELELDFNVSKGGNSGVMLHCADDEGDYMWYSGPEVQIYDDHGEEGAQKTGYLYELYSSTVDATKPAGQWNHFRIVVAPRKCETYVNGVKYYEWEPGSKDFWERVAKSKFSAMPMFGKLQNGTIGIQGDHGTVSFRNIKVRPLTLIVK